MLQPKQCDLLILLTSHPDKLLKHAEIRKSIWADVHVEFPGALHSAIRELRRKLGDSVARPIYIRTVRDVGYVFIHPVTVAAEAGAVETADKEIEKALSATAPNGVPATLQEIPPRESTEAAVEVVPPDKSAEETEESERRHKPTRRVIAASAMVAALLIVITYILFRNHSPAKPLSLAVLPVLNITGNSANNSLSDSITDALITQLTMTAKNSVRLVGVDSARSLEEQHMEAGEAGKALGATYVLKCTVQRGESGPALNFTMQLFRVADDALIWTRWFTGDGKDILASTGRLSAEMLAELPLTVKPDPKPPTHLAPRSAEEAYRRGKQAQWERTEESLNEALDDFKAATQADPNYADAFAQLGATYELLGQYGWMNQADAMAKGDDSVDTALRLNPSLPDGLTARGFSRWFYHWNWDSGEKDFKQAIKLDASNVNAMHWYALALATAGHSAEAAEQMERALALEPKSRILRSNRGWLDYMSGHFDSAAEAMEAVLREDPYFLSARFKLWAVYSCEKRYDDAYRQLNFLLLGTLPAEDREHLNRVYRERGYQKALQEWRRHAAGSIEGNTLFTVQIAAFAGDRDAAVNLLTQALRAHDGWMVFLLNDPALQSVRTDSRLETFMHELTKNRR